MVFAVLLNLAPAHPVTEFPHLINVNLVALPVQPGASLPCSSLRPCTFLTLGPASSLFLWEAFPLSHPSSTLSSGPRSNSTDSTKPTYLLLKSAISLTTLLRLQLLRKLHSLMKYYIVLIVYCCRILFLVSQVGCWKCMTSPVRMQGKDSCLFILFEHPPYAYAYIQKYLLST